MKKKLSIAHIFLGFQDIANALLNDYPFRLLEKLENRRSKAKSLASKQIQHKYYLDLPTLSSPPNPLIQCASDAVEIKQSATMGRHVIATKDVLPGDVIALERPFAKILLKERIFNHCHHCLTLCYNLLPCPQCTEALFCSKFCLEEAKELYHKYECPYLNFLHNFNFSKLELLALRVTVLAKNYYETLEQASEIYKSERYEEIHQLVTNTEKRKIPDLFRKSVVAAVLTHVFQDEMSDILMRHLQTGPSNFHEISECVGSTTKCYATEDIGCGAFSFLSLFNHSCSPNVVRHCHDSTVVLRALRPIKRGEQLFDNYGWVFGNVFALVYRFFCRYHHALMTKAERQDHLKNQYLFECSCIACEEDWPLYHDLKQLDYHLELDPLDLEALREGNRETAQAIVNDLLKKLEELDETIPSRNLADAQETVKQCFALFGNKNIAF